MKSGTSSLFNYLAQHPEICPSKIKEPGFFALDHEWNKGLAHYERLWQIDASRHKVALEGSTQYTKRPTLGHVPERIASLTDHNFRFIYIMRHPLRRIESQIQHLSSNDGRAVSLDNDDGALERAVQLSSYAYQLDAYAETFPRENLCLISFEELRAAPQATLDRIVGFLGLSQFVFPETEKVFNPGRNYAPHPLWARFSRISSLKQFIVRHAPTAVRDALRRIGSRPLKGRYKLNEAEEAQILERLLPDLRRLSTDYGFDVEGKWGIKLT